MGSLEVDVDRISACVMRVSRRASKRCSCWVVYWRRVARDSSRDPQRRCDGPVTTDKVTRS